MYRRLGMFSARCAGVVVPVLTVVGLSEICLAQEVVQIGQGSYYENVPAGYERPSDNTGQPVAPRVTADFTGAIPTNEWWSSLIWERYAGNTTGQNMFPLPLAIKAESHGLSLAHLQGFSISSVAYFQSFGAAATIGVDGLIAPEVQVAHAGDWTVTAAWANESQSMQATFGHGLPYIYFQMSGGDAVLDIHDDQTLVNVDQRTVTFQVNGVTYAAFAPSGSEWIQTSNGQLRSSLNGLGYLTVAALPDNTTETQSLFEAHAHAVVTDTTATWTYDEQTGALMAHFNFDVDVKEGDQSDPLTALFRHQWLYVQQSTLDLSYESPRGVMKLISASDFDVSFPFKGLMPWLPKTDAIDQQRLAQYLQDVLNETDLFPASDTYWVGKSLGRAAQLVPLAEQAGMIRFRDQLIQSIKAELEDWLTAGQPVNEDSSESGSSAYDRLEAEDYSEANGVVLCAGEDKSDAVCGFGDGDWIRIDAVDFGQIEPPGVLLRVASGVGTGGSALIELRLDSVDGPLIGNGAVANTGGWDAWTDFNIAVSPEVLEQLGGVHDLYVLCETGYPEDVWNLDWLRFNGGSTGPSGGNDTTFFAREDAWSTLIGYPSSYGSAGQLNDHHFHYGYFIAAAAVVAMYEPDWAAPDQWGAMVELLIKDAANWDRTDSRFPYLRNMDPYAGYSLASGHQGFASGNNQESSSEAINFAYGVMMWGQATGQTDIRDLGIYLYASEASAIAQYWFDVDETNFPVGFPHPMISIVWSNGGDYATWWTGNVEEIHGINVLPVTAATLHLGHWPEMIQDNWDYLISRNPGQPTVWQDILWSFLAMSDGGGALSAFESNQNYVPEPGDSRAHTYHWLSSLADLGRPVADVTADIASYAIFDNGVQRTYMAWNPESQDRQVTFSDGFVGCASAGQVMVLSPTLKDCQCQGDLDGDGQVGIGDFAVFLIAFGQTGENPADFNGDLVVNIDDFSIFLLAFGAPCD